ncbi:MAG TPA: cobyrinate a,c-diamide synthase, partial [Gemmataceae bacterium]|nr:cobyrinate a,c-diamide synthase [Gemmataceae bacterium]
ERVRSLFARATADADVAVIEGVMGLYDGADYEYEAGSTAEVAKLLAAPVVLVIDAAKMARSAGAVALGYRRFDEGVPLAGFVVNRVAGVRHGSGVASAIARATGFPVLGCLPRDEVLHVPERHLGLIPTAEPGRWEQFLDAAGDLVDRHLGIDRLLAVARQAPPLPAVSEGEFPPSADHPVIAVARDEAFHFTYEDNLDLLRAAGAQIVFFSPLRDEALPAGAGCVILSGGFPEVFAERLAANRPMHDALRAGHRRGLPIYAECGGLMYLTEAIIEKDGTGHAMVGLLPGRSVMSGRLTLGYRLARVESRSWVLPRGEMVRGHEFHYSVWEHHPATVRPAWSLLSRSGGGGLSDPRPEGACVGSLWASYVHLHFAGRDGLAERFVAAARHPTGGGGA